MLRSLALIDVLDHSEVAHGVAGFVADEVRSRVRPNRGSSYGFRPGRSAHHAMDALVVGIGSRKVNWILDADIRSFFDSISQEWLVRLLEHRIGDQRIIRLIQK